MTQTNFITQDDAFLYERDGYVLKEDVFTPDEVAAMIRDVEGGDRVAALASGLADESGQTARIALWSDIGDDIWGAASTCPRIVNSIRVLLGEEVAFFHGKVMLKEAHTGGAWEWHQDYGYWYDQMFAFPRMISAFVALDEATVENGCLQVLRGSHKLGRLSHGQVGDQTGADITRIGAIEQLLERVHCTMKPGSVLYFHCNLLHASSSNNSDRHRRSFIMCYNALANPQLDGRQWSQPYPCPVGSDDAIMKFA